MDALLESWEISEETIEVFLRHNIDLSCLDGLGTEELNILIPDSKLRDRIKFKTGYKKYKEELQTVHSNTDSLDTLSCDSLESIVFSDAGQGEQKENFELNLQEILGDNIYGRQALQSIKEKRLSSTTRNYLVKGIIEFYLKKNIKLTKCYFEAIANEIVRVCPNECKETYYVPSRCVGSKNYMPAKGKLIDRYYNQLRALRVSGVLPKKRKLSNDVTDSEIESELDEEVYTWLKFNRDPWPVVEQKWRETVIYRKNKTYDSDKQLTEIINEWPCIKCSNGFRLIEIDFQHIYPNKELLLFEKWDKFVSKSFEIIIRENIAGTGIAEKLGDNVGTRDFIIFNALAQIIKPTSKVLDTDKKKYNKVSVLESQQAFLMLVKNYSDIEESLQQRRNCYNRKGLTCQPIIVCVGNLTQQESFYVVINELKYEFESLAKAMDICFKCFTVLNLAYPKECEQLWLFIQQYFYEIHLRSDKKFSNVSTFVKQLED